MIITFAWGAWIMLVLLIILCFSLKINERIKTMDSDIKCIRYTQEINIKKITQNKKIWR